MNLKFLNQREIVIHNIRSFFDEQNFHEVITPILNTGIPTEPNIFPFATTWKTLNDEVVYFLPTSPEKNLKAMLASGIENCYSIGHCFRNLEASGPRHTPEFLMLEWYRENATYQDIMRDTKQLLSKLTQSDQEWESFSLVTLFQEKCHLELEEITKGDVLFQIAEKRGYSIDHASWSEIFDQIFLNEIEPFLPKTPFFLVDFPSRISPFCTPQKNKPYLVERFEFYLDGIEIGNGNTEFTDADAIQSSILNESNRRKEKGMLVSPIDVDFIASLKKLDATKKSYAGIGIGIDRLTRYVANQNES